MADDATGRYAVLIRPPGWLDRFARREPRSDFYKPDDFNAWVWHGMAFDKAEMGTWDSEAEAQAHADMLAEKFGSIKGYRFDVCRERLVPRWFLANPKDDRERAAIGSRGQI